MTRQIVWIAVLALAGCNIPPEVKLEMTCTTICGCFVGPGGDVDECVTECIDDGDFALLPEDCFECIQAHANQCATLESDCEPICETPRPPPELPDGGMQ